MAFVSSRAVAALLAAVVFAGLSGSAESQPTLGCPPADLLNAYPCPSPAVSNCNADCCVEHTASSCTSSASALYGTCNNQLGIISVSACSATANTRVVTLDSSSTEISHVCVYAPTCLTQSGGTCTAVDTTGGCGTACSATNTAQCTYLEGPISSSFIVAGGGCIEFVIKNAKCECGTYTGRLFQDGSSTTTVANWQCGEDSSSTFNSPYTDGTNVVCDSAPGECIHTVCVDPCVTPSPPPAPSNRFGTSNLIVKCGSDYIKCDVDDDNVHVTCFYVNTESLVTSMTTLADVCDGTCELVSVKAGLACCVSDSSLYTIQRNVKGRASAVVLPASAGSVNIGRCTPRTTPCDSSSCLYGLLKTGTK